MGKLRKSDFTICHLAKETGFTEFPICFQANPAEQEIPVSREGHVLIDLCAAPGGSMAAGRCARVQ